MPSGPMSVDIIKGTPRNIQLGGTDGKSLKTAGKLTFNIKDFDHYKMIN